MVPSGSATLAANMDQDGEKTGGTASVSDPVTVDAIGVASERAAIPRMRRVKRDRAGENAIERIAAAAQALAETEIKSTASSEVPPSSALSGSTMADTATAEPIVTNPIAPEPSALTSSAPKPIAPKPIAPKPSALTAGAMSVVQRVRSSGHLPYYAAALCFTLGFGGLVGSRLQATEVGAVADADSTRIEHALPWKRDVAESVPRESVKLWDDVRVLRGEIVALRANGDQLRQAEREKQMGEVRSLRAALEAQKAETASLKADLAVKIERADREVAQRSDKTAERVDRLERRLADPVATGATLAPSKQAAEASNAQKPAEKTAVPGIVLRDAGRGVALLETRRGLLEVVKGDVVPGAGKVEAIEHNGSKWRVVTSSGFIEGRLD